MHPCFDLPLVVGLTATRASLFRRYHLTPKYLEHIYSSPIGMNISSRQLKAFVLTARHQSFSRAAEQLFITQSGMSVLVRELEAQLGFRLFDRTTRKVTLTQFGTKFLPVAERSLRDLETAALHLSRAAASAGRS